MRAALGPTMVCAGLWLLAPSGRAAPPQTPTTDARGLGPADFAGQPSRAAMQSAPLVLGETIIAAHWDAQHGGTLVGEKRLYVVREDGTWRAREWPDEVRPHAVVMLGERLAFVGEPGALYVRADAEHFDHILVSGIDDRTRNLAWRRAWLNLDKQQLWVLAGADRLLRIDLTLERNTGDATTFPIPHEGSTRGQPQLIGEPGGPDRPDKVAVAVGASVFAWRDGEVVEVGRHEAPVTELSFVGEATVVASAKSPDSEQPQAREFSLAPRHDESPTQLTAHDQRVFDTITRADRAADRVKTRPGGDTFWFPTVRMGPALELRFDDPVAAFGMDVGVGVLLAPPSSDGHQRGHALRPVEPWFWPEIGYSYSTDARSLSHSVFAGVGFGVGNDFVAGYYKPRGVLGRFDQGPRAGLRHGLSVQAFWGALGIEFSHGVAFFDDSSDAGLPPVRHDLRIGLDINLVPFVWALTLLRN